jgi:hypothetical protein
MKLKYDEMNLIHAAKGYQTKLFNSLINRKGMRRRCKLCVT